MKSFFRALLFLPLGTLFHAANAQDTKIDLQPYHYVGHQGSWYFSWGYNKEWYTHSSIHISQPSLGNDYTFKNVFAEDKVGWDHQFFHTPITIPQYNYRLGHWFKDDWAVEINFDHTKYQVAQAQYLHLEGTLNHRQVDTFFVNNGNLLYQLNNGANFFLFNIVHRIQVPHLNYKYFNASLLLKGGVGFMWPHVQNTIFGHDNSQGFQFGGLDMGVEGDLRLTFFKNIYLEYCNKGVFTDYWGLTVYEGKARQNFGTYEMILNLGVDVPLGHPERHKKS
jgi:hypothetical protein